MHIGSQLMRVNRCPGLLLLLFVLGSLFRLLLFILLLLQEVVLEPKGESVHDDWRYDDHQDEL